MLAKLSLGLPDVLSLLPLKLRGLFASDHVRTQLPGDLLADLEALAEVLDARFDRTDVSPEKVHALLEDVARLLRPDE